MTDPAPAPGQRPRPQFGEYATPEEQRARIQEPAPWQQVAAAPAVTETPSPGIPPARAAAQPPPRAVDRIVTVALLAYGLVNVLSSFFAFLDYASYADATLALLGVDAEFSDPSAGRGWGIAAAVVLAIGWIGTLLLSIWSMRRGRLTWWIPLAAGIVFTFAAGVLVAVPLLSDPAVLQAIIDSAGAG